MEWIEVTAKTVEEAKDAALDQLGVDEVDAEFEVVETPKPGLFGRLRSEARVRARVLPTTPPPKLDRRERRRSRDSGRAPKAQGPERPERPDRAGGAGPERPDRAGGAGPERPDRAGDAGPERPSRSSTRGTRPPREAAPARKDGDEMSEQAVGSEDEIASGFLGGLLDAFGLSATIEPRQLEEDTTEVVVEGEGLGLLIGPRGQTLMAVQELTRTVVQRNLPAGHGRIVIDIGGYRQARRAALERFTRSVADEVLADGKPKVLEAMPPADRKVVHDTVNAIPGVITLSEGEEPRRRVVITPESTE